MGWPGKEMKARNYWLGVLATALLVLPGKVSGADDYKLGPDSFPQAGVPRGKVEKFSFNNSKLQL